MHIIVLQNFSIDSLAIARFLLVVATYIGNCMIAIAPLL